MARSTPSTVTEASAIAAWVSLSVIVPETATRVDITAVPERLASNVPLPDAPPTSAR